MGIRPIDMQLMVQNTNNLPKEATQKVEHNPALAQNLAEDFNKKINKIVDQKIDNTRNEQDVKNRFKEEKKKSKHRRKRQNDEDEKKEKTIHLDLSV